MDSNPINLAKPVEIYIDHLDIVLRDVVIVADLGANIEYRYAVKFKYSDGKWKSGLFDSHGKSQTSSKVLRNQGKRKHTRYVNIFKGDCEATVSTRRSLFLTEEAAQLAADPRDPESRYLTTVPVTWEE